MEITWVSVKDALPEMNEKVLTCDKAFPNDGFEWEEMIAPNEWGASYSVTHWARMSVVDVDA